MTVKARVGVAALAITFGVRVALAICDTSATFDEPEYVTAGYSYLVTGEYRLDIWHPPLALVLAGTAVRARLDLPFEPDRDAWARGRSRVVARELLYAPGRDAAAILHTARIPSFLFGLATILLVGAWAARLWGPRAGWVALALAARSEPNLIAHAASLTRPAADIAVTFGMTLAAYLWWRFLQRPTRGGWIACAIACAVAVASKHVGLLLGPILLATAIAHIAHTRALGALRRPAIELAVVAAIAVVLADRHRCDRPASPTGSGQQIWHLDHVPSAYLARRGRPTRLVVLLPRRDRAEAAARRARARWHRGRARRLAARRTGGARRADHRGHRVRVVVAHRAPAVHLILPAIPFVIVLAARAASLVSTRVLAVAVAAVIASSAVATTRELAYGNELAQATGGTRAGLSYSTVDWGQDLDRLAAYAGDTPVYLAYFGGGSPTHAGIRHATLHTATAFPPDADLVGDRDEPTAPCAASRQLIAISAFRQAGVIEWSPELYGWLDALDYVSIGASIRVYDVTGDAESHARLAHDPRPPRRRPVAARSIARSRSTRPCARGLVRPLGGNTDV